MEQLKTHPTIGVCGLDCGLCPRHYTVGTSRCPGCGGPGFSTKHPSCSFITCAVKKKGLEACGQCGAFPCPKFKGEEAYRQAPASTSYPPPSIMLSNLAFIRDKGIEAFLARQRERIGLLEAMIEGFDDGRSRSFFCRAAALLDPGSVRRSLDEANRATEAGGTGGRAAKAKVLRALLLRAALSEGHPLGQR